MIQYCIYLGSIVCIGRKRNLLKTKGTHGVIFILLFPNDPWYIDRHHILSPTVRFFFDMFLSLISCCSFNLVSNIFSKPKAVFRLGDDLRVVLTVLKCQIQLSTILMNKGKLYTLLAYFIYNNLIPHVLASIWFQKHKSTIGGKHTQNAGKMHRRSYPTITQR
jgi:hypothetical protein